MYSTLTMEYVAQSPWIATVIVAATIYCTLRWVQYWRSWVCVIAGRSEYIYIEVTDIHLD
jgi:hypothetical protein